MSSAPDVLLSPLANDVLAGLLTDGQKKLSPRYLYDELGSRLFDAICALPEYGLTRADTRVLKRCAKEVARHLGTPCVVTELGSGVGKKTSHILKAIRVENLNYYPIDVSAEALADCKRQLDGLASVEPIHGDYFEGLDTISRKRAAKDRMLVLFLGSTIGNFERGERQDFLTRLHRSMRPGDLLLVGADLMKDVDQMIAAYDDPTGVTAAFNLNLLGRINRELNGNFNLKAFTHLAVWNHEDQRIEMHLVSRRKQRVFLRTLNICIEFESGETIWTESSHKFSQHDLDTAASESGFTVVSSWVDAEWPFVEALWRV